MTATDITSAITTVTGTFGTIAEWFPVQAAAGIFIAAASIALVARFFGKRSRKKR